MKDIKDIKREIVNALLNDKFENGDLTDIGNTIGIVIAKYFDKAEMGFDKESFISGLKHGISLTDGTH